ncbi:phenylacetate--CoA ligase family protein [Schaedlerella arabinosiphila]|uniref:Phenylacetate--CoA ligase family protein n=2 Tax=Schaedlerella arabinosiphila TaxID=2044587 RepID=A0A3R8JNS4_9FIRM|nr:phenylacetate--CoA ligase family protein [Schaedlerella arabinosiphila]
MGNRIAKDMINLSPPVIRVPFEFAWGVIPANIKYGKEYRRSENLLKESQWWEYKQHDEYQIFKLKELLEYAYRHVPYYQELFKSINFSPDTFHDLDDIQKIPFSDKNIVNGAGKRMVSDLYKDKDIAVSTTGGTSGIQTRFYNEKGAYGKRELPYINSIWGRIGYVRGKSKLARLRNEILPKGKLWSYDYKNKELIIDSYHLSDENIELILNKLSNWKVEFLHTYPSAALVLCDYLKRMRKEGIVSLKGVLVTSENIYEGQKEEIEKYLGARCFTFYGHSEGAGIAGWCEKSDFYHINTEYGYLELIDENGQVITEPNKMGEIVCTGFNNKVSPFIRYRTGDYSSYCDVQSCPCGRHYKLLNDIKGRWLQEYFIGKKGNKISMASVNMHNGIFDHVRNYQFVQNQVGECIIKIVKDIEYGEEDELKILEELGAKVGDSLSIKIDYVNEISRTKAGKQRFIISNIK